MRLQDMLCKLKRQFQELQLTDVDKDQTRQRDLYKGAQKVALLLGRSPVACWRDVKRKYLLVRIWSATLISYWSF